MENPAVSKELSEKLYERLLELSQEATDMEWGREDETSEFFQTYSYGSEMGKRFFNSLSDEQLLSVIRQNAEKYGHSPAKKEMFWVWREYIKIRFGKWPYALKAAGLDKSAGKGGKTLEETKRQKDEITVCLEEIRKTAKQLGRIPHPKDLPEVCEKLKRYVPDWGEAVCMAGVDASFFRESAVSKLDDLEKVCQKGLEEIRKLAETLNRPPLRSEVEDSLRKELIARCGSWRNVLYQIDLEPVIRMKPFSSTYIDYRKKEQSRSHKSSLQDCFYQVIHLDEQSKQELVFVKKLSEETGHVPDKKEIPSDMRKHLQETCGSYANALYQIGLK